MDEPDQSSAPTRPRFFAASLNDHNNGILHGAWIDASADASMMLREIMAMLDRSPTFALFGEPAEEWAVFDSEGFQEPLDPFTTLDEIASSAEHVGRVPDTSQASRLSNAQSSDR